MLIGCPSTCIAAIVSRGFFVHAVSLSSRHPPPLALANGAPLVELEAWHRPRPADHACSCAPLICAPFAHIDDVSTPPPAYLHASFLCIPRRSLGCAASCALPALVLLQLDLS
ncbi:hypothetical protein GQ55_2G168500 [Panicum hallii var. hallii]|uniref:Uncharacterized protein n=1 Tax=Panicum hallii var. hallii TaxID=1504633 RepID=A0A2T7EQ39_9POAL|nr:hypothetical protein GQ55_2G168500 [Panicum hallii var. hallii]